MVKAEAPVVVPISIEAPTQIRRQALREQAGPETPTSVSLSLNGRTLEARPLENGWHSYEWDVPAGALQQGPNDAVIRLDRLPLGEGSPRRGFAVADIAVIR